MFNSLTQVTICQLQRKLDGYKFPVWTTKSCPKDKTEWDDRSSLFNCNYESSYACLPNENFTELLEFCYPLQNIAIEKGKYIDIKRKIMNCTKKKIHYTFLICP